MKVYLASDHAGFELKKKVGDFLTEKGYEVVDCGAEKYDADDDYPVFIGKAAKKIFEDKGSRGIILGGSGQGEAMVANKYEGVRCALFYAPAIPNRAVDISGIKSADEFEMLRLTRLHNNSNMLSLGARFLKTEDALRAVEIFLETSFSEAERHKRRIGMIDELDMRE